MTEADGEASPVVAPAGSVPAVSVCIPLYMKEDFVERTVRSVLDQTFTDFELVILHNASPDHSAKIVESFTDPRIRLLHNDHTITGAENVEKVLTFATAPLIKILAADDVLHPTTLERQVAVMADPTIAVVSCRQNMIDESDKLISRDRSLRNADLIGRRDRQTVVRRVVRHAGNPIGAYVNLLFRRADYEAIAGMPQGVPWIAYDLALVLALLMRGDFYGLPETLVDFRIAAGSSSAAQATEGLRKQLEYINGLRDTERALLRPTDGIACMTRIPLMRVRHRMIIAAAGDPSKVGTRVVRRLLGISRKVD